MEKKFLVGILIVLLIGLSIGYILGYTINQEPNNATIKHSYQTWEYEGRLGKGEFYWFTNITTGGYREVTLSIWVIGPQLGPGLGHTNATITVNIGFGPVKGLSRDIDSFRVRTQDRNIWKTYPVVGAFMTVRIQNFEDTSASFSCWIYATT